MSKPIPNHIRSQRLQQLHKYMAAHNLKTTRQRDLIVQIFFNTLEHISVEELYEKAKEKDSNIGFATVYRTMKMLTDSGLANRRNFGDGHTRFENTYEGEHHDHMICNSCGNITEFESQALDTLKDEIAEKNNFSLQYHQMQLYGLCGKCQRASAQN